MIDSDSVSKPRIAVLGSCVTRDAFEIPEAEEFELTTYFARSALGSFMGRPTNAVSPDYSRIASSFQRRMALADIQKRGRKQLRSESFDVLVLDLIDERLPLARFSDGGIATVSSEFRLLGISLQEYTKIQSHTEESWRLWKAGWTTLVKLLDQIGAREKIVVHRAHWVGRSADGAPTVKDPSTVAAANRWLDDAYSHMARDLGDHQFIDVVPEFQLGDPVHRWGLAPFHYVPEYYRDFLRRLSAFQEGL